ncbi:WD domain, g-beta repeat domain-containing protein [Ditylenchus destructor]|uniref:WD domain, g-beta repeat domain-containing protein n=1 Tax=Ditylenchus destructor TaxID=166010 RepID=A0AAD4NEL8_9BILA|nr:WD domain, g-beta repeat domain-containing protein [Ditylenchus destructor]
MIAEGDNPEPSTSQASKYSPKQKSLPHRMAVQKAFDEQTEAEFLIHIQLYLESLGFKDSSRRLSQEIEQNGLIAKRYNFLGQSCPQTYDEYVQKIRPFSTDLRQAIIRLHELTSERILPVIPNLPIRLFASKRQSLLRTKDHLVEKACDVKLARKRPSINTMEKANPIKLLTTRQLGATSQPIPTRLLLRKESLHNLDLHCRILGHLASIFCVKLDRTGRYIFTGADDNLIKVWDAQTCMLRYTFRGHSGEIADMAVSPENTMLASGSVDKTVRVWCLQRGSTLMVYKGHTALLTTIAFLPFVKDDVRYLVSAGNDCTVVFYKYSAKKKDFSEAPTKFNERARPGARIICSCHSPGGNLVAMGDTHEHIRIFKVSEASIERLYEMEAHGDRVDSLVWAHNSLRFVSGSKDGTAKVWFIKNNTWSSVELNPFPVNQQNKSSQVLLNSSNARYPRLAPNGRGGYCMSLTQPQSAGAQNKKNSYKVTMLCWSLADDQVISSGSDNLLRTWDWATGQLLKVLDAHVNESFALWPHPIHKELVVSAGHDGLLIVWDIYQGKPIKKQRNENDRHELAAIFDLAVSPDGTTVAYVDTDGFLSILGLSSNQKLFFRQLTMDQAGYVLDENTGLAPHNMDPPILVNSEGIPYPDDVQKMTPGNDLVNNPIVKLCPWISRQIIPELSAAKLDQVLSLRSEITSKEALEFQESLKDMDNTIQHIPSSSRQLVPRTTKQGPAQKRKPQSRPRYSLLYHHEPGVPRYIIPREYDRTDSDDSSYSGDGDLEATHYSDEEATTNSMDNSGSSGELNNEDEFVDDEDSDYQEGGQEHDSVFRRRSGITVTGRRTKRREVANSSNTSSQSTESNLPSSSQTRQSNSRSRRQPRGSQSRPSKRAVISSEDEGKPKDSMASSPNAETKYAKQVIASGTKKTSLRGIKRKVTIKEEDEFEDDQPSTSQANVSRREPKTDRKKKAGETEMIENYPHWMRMTERRRFPYVAQLGDVVVYCIQGHRKYIEELEKAKLLKRIPTNMRPRTDLDAMEVCIVDYVEYVSQPFRMTHLRLAQCKNNARTGLVIEFRYHDLENSPDFIVLKQHYDLSISYGFKAGQHVETLLNDRFYTGHVERRSPENEDYPTSEWCSVEIQWDNDDEEDRYCPWDLQPKSELRKSDTQASKEEIEKWGDYTAQAGDWPLPEGLASSSQERTAIEEQSIYLNRAKTAIQQIMTMKESAEFREAVNLVSYPDYCKVVKYPIDLQTIEERISNNYYRRSLSLLQDVQYLAINAGAFNEPDSEITTFSQAIVEAIFRYLKDASIQNIGNLFNELISKADGSELSSWKTQLQVPGTTSLQVMTDFDSFDMDSGADEGLIQKKPQKKSPNTPRSLGAGSQKIWITDCKQMVQQLMRPLKCLDTPEMRDFCVGRLNLQNLADNIEIHSNPQNYLETIGNFFSEFKAFLDDRGGRRSTIYKEILQAQSQLESKSKPICAKFRLMEEEAHRNGGTDSTGLLTYISPKRAAALSAQEIWRVRLASTVAGFKKYESSYQDNSSEGSKRYNTRQHGARSAESSNEHVTDDYGEDQQPCSSKSLFPQPAISSQSGSSKSHNQINAQIVPNNSLPARILDVENSSSLEQYPNSDTGATATELEAGCSQTTQDLNNDVQKEEVMQNGHKLEISEEASPSQPSSGDEYKGESEEPSDCKEEDSMDDRRPAKKKPNKRETAGRIKASRKRIQSNSSSADENPSSLGSSESPTSFGSDSSAAFTPNSTKRTNTKRSLQKTASRSAKPPPPKRTRKSEGSTSSSLPHTSNGNRSVNSRRQTRKAAPLGSYEEVSDSEGEGFSLSQTTTRTGRAVKANTKYKSRSSMQ